MTSFKDGICERCCKRVSQDDGSIHTCTPTNGWREMEAEIKRLNHDVEIGKRMCGQLMAEIGGLNTALQKRKTENERLRDAVQYACNVFLEYEQMHLAKGPEGLEKAIRNAEHANRMTLALLHHNDQLDGREASLSKSG